MHNGWRLVLVTGERIAFPAPEPALTAALGDLVRLAAEGGVQADFFQAQKAVAS
jgi:hypothetical protein